MRFAVLMLLMLFGFSCKHDVDLVQYQDGKQLLTLNELKRNGEKFVKPLIIKVSEDSVTKGQELLVKIFFEKSDLKLVDAFIECDSTINPKVDTTSNQISGCSKGLVVRNDTILIGFHPMQLGTHKFPEITILTMDNERIFRTMTYSFDYTVIN